MDMQDFVNAHLVPIDMYRPLVSSCFIFTASLSTFPVINEDFRPYFWALFILSIGKMVLTVFHFHVSFYSRSSECWDRCGWYFLVTAVFMVRVAIPIASMVIAIDAYMKFHEGSNCYSLLLLFHAVTSCATTCSYIFFFKRQFLDTHTWYKNRRNMSNKVLNVDEDSMKDQNLKDWCPT